MIRDERSRRVAFVSHCLLNQNVRLSATDRETFNARAVRECLVAGQGLFIAALRRELMRRAIGVPFLEWHVGAAADAESF